MLTIVMLSSVTSVFTRATRRHIAEYGIFISTLLRSVIAYSIGVVSVYFDPICNVNLKVIKFQEVIRMVASKWSPNFGEHLLVISDSEIYFPGQIGPAILSINYFRQLKH
jgi:hypothetical protein